MDLLLSLSSSQASNVQFVTADGFDSQSSSHLLLTASSSPSLRTVQTMAARMLPTRPGTSAIRSLSKRRPSCSQRILLYRPHSRPFREGRRKHLQSRRNVQQQQPPPQHRNRGPYPVQPSTRISEMRHHLLVNQQVPELDDSFVGLSGGQIFHEMMLRQGVKHICKSERSCRATVLNANLLISWLSWWCHSTCIRCYLQLETLRFHSSQT